MRNQAKFFRYTAVLTLVYWAGSIITPKPVYGFALMCLAILLSLFPEAR